MSAHHTHRSPRGMALMAVIMLFVLIGVAVVSMTLLFSTEIHRTRAAVNGAQLRQLLLAGSVAAAAELQTHGAAERDLAMKVPLDNAATTLHIASATPDAATVRITASLRDARAAEVVKMTRDAKGAWSIASATLRE